jgi:two-component system, response regulator YesN
MNVFIADDESYVLEGLKVIIDWNKLGFSICGEAQNGEDALNKILELQPDLVLLDIRMPKLTGIEIVKIAREKNFTGKFIIISGVSDFKYAQTAMRYGVDFYLTKPIDEDELTSAVISVSDDLKKERKNNNTMLQYREKARDTILRDLLVGKADFLNFNSGDFHLNATVYQVVIYENYKQDDFHTIWSFADLLRVTNQDNNSFDHIHFQEKDIILLKGNFAIEHFKVFLHHYDMNPQTLSPLDSLFLTYGRKVYSLDDVHYSYKEACSLLNRRFFCEQNQHFLGYLELPKEEEFTYTISSDECRHYYQLFTDYIQSFNRTKVAETFKELEKKLFLAKEDVMDIKYFLTDIYLQVKQIISHIYNNLDIPFPANAAVINLVESKYYLYEIILFLSEQFEIYMKAIGNSSGDSVLNDILHYINHNYGENLKLEAIAPLFGYNSSYLGKIFNKKVGESFNSYLDRVRIENSKKLLAEDKLKVYEIAEQVGYKNVDYFHKKFKKIVGESPAEYRKKPN